ncbi:MAG: DUF1700 domain-containing protein [Eubacteriales bacterium]|nr:DUF1700 domain-containing protein [Eubacteriales bacterium]
MNRREFILRLEQALKDMPAEERRRAVEYYENYFDEAGPENEQEVLKALGAPEKVAADILRDYYENNTGSQQQKADGKQMHTARENAARSIHTMRDKFQTMDSGQRLLVIVLAILALATVAPACIGMIGGLGGLIIALICVVFTIFLLVPTLDLVAWCCAIGFAVAAGLKVATNPPLALCFIGIALIFAAVGVLLWQLTVYLFRITFPALIRGIVDFFRGILHWNT